MNKYLETGTINLIPHLIALGFEEMKSDLFIKKIEGDIRLFVDYRNEEREIYAYNLNKVVDHKKLKEYKAIMKIEKRLTEEKEGTLLGYVNA